jgi:hypothetical protein
MSTIAFMVDEKVSKERMQIATRALGALRSSHPIEVIPANVGESGLLSKLKAGKYSLVLLPHHRYLEWSKIDGHFGLNRTTGPAVAGYFCEPVAIPTAASVDRSHRAILLDLSGPAPAEALLLIRALAQERLRSGIQPLLDAQTAIYAETWFARQKLGQRMDAVLALPEIEQEWKVRAPAIRACLSAFWAIAQEEMVSVAGGTSAKGYLAVGADRQCLALRLCYPSPGLNTREAILRYWPDASRPLDPAQILGRYADAVRLHTIADTSEIELTAVLFKSAPSAKSLHTWRTLWIDPIAQSLIFEVPYEAPNPSNPRLRGLPVGAEPPATNAANTASTAVQAKERQLMDMAAKVRELKAELGDKEALIRELRSGGVGTAAPLAPPDAESLLDALTERFNEAEYQIRQFHEQVTEIQKNGATKQQVEALRSRIAILATRENQWVQTLLRMLHTYRDGRKKDGTG